MEKERKERTIVGGDFNARTRNGGGDREEGENWEQEEKGRCSKDKM